jgi:hypothetical protein
VTLDPAPSIAPAALPLFLDHADGSRRWSRLGLPASVIFPALYTSFLEGPERADAVTPGTVRGAKTSHIEN